MFLRYLYLAKAGRVPVQPFNPSFSPLISSVLCLLLCTKQEGILLVTIITRKRKINLKQLNLSTDV
jgi:hypothetical protein